MHSLWSTERWNFVNPLEVDVSECFSVNCFSDSSLHLTPSRLNVDRQEIHAFTSFSEPFLPLSSLSAVEYRSDSPQNQAKCTYSDNTVVNEDDRFEEQHPNTI